MIYSSGLRQAEELIESGLNLLPTGEVLPRFQNATQRQCSSICWNASYGSCSATGLFFFLGGCYSTIVLHNAFAVGGVVQALGDGGVTTNVPVCSFR